MLRLESFVVVVFFLGYVCTLDKMFDFTRNLFANSVNYQLKCN